MAALCRDAATPIADDAAASGAPERFVLASATRRGKHRRNPAPTKTAGPTGKQPGENRADPPAGLQNPAALHPGDFQTHPLAARPLASTHLATASPAPATPPLCQTLTTQTRRQSNFSTLLNFG